MNPNRTIRFKVVTKSRFNDKGCMAKIETNLIRLTTLNVNLFLTELINNEIGGNSWLVK